MKKGPKLLWTYVEINTFLTQSYVLLWGKSPLPTHLLRPNSDWISIEQRYFSPSYQNTTKNGLILQYNDRKYEFFVNWIIFFIQVCVSVCVPDQSYTKMKFYILIFIYWNKKACQISKAISLRFNGKSCSLVCVCVCVCIFAACTSF